MPGVIKDAWDWATTSPEFVKKRVKQAHESVEPRSVFDEPYEKYTKPAIHAAIDTADTFATPLDAAGVLAGGAGFAGAEIANRLRRLPKVSNMEHYIDAIRLGKTPTEATKIAASGGRRAADKARIAEEIEAQFRPRNLKPKVAEDLGGYAVNGREYLRMSPAERAAVRIPPKSMGGPVRQTAGAGKSGLIDLAEAVRKNARRPYFNR
jgi:hypothetical protein